MYLPQSMMKRSLLIWRCCWLNQQTQQRDASIILYLVDGILLAKRSQQHPSSDLFPHLGYAGHTSIHQVARCQARSHHQRSRARTKLGVKAVWQTG